MCLFTHAGLALMRCRSGYKGEHYILKCVADALFLAFWNVGNSRGTVKNDAEVDATGRYILSRGVPMANHAVLHTFRVHYIYQRRGCQFYFVYCTGFLRPQRANEVGAGYPAFLYVVAINLIIRPIWVFLGRQMN